MLSGKEYRALALDPDSRLDVNAVVQLREDCQDSVLAVMNQMQRSSILGKVGGQEIHGRMNAMKYVFVSGIPISEYDLIVSDSFGQMQSMAISALKPILVIFQEQVWDIGDQYQYMMPGIFVRQDYILRFQQYLNQQSQAQQVAMLTQDQDVESKLNDWGLQVQRLVPQQVSNSVQCQYLNEMREGMVSIIIVINTRSQKVVSLIRKLKLQDLPQVQFIVINNGITLKNAVGQKVAVTFKDPVQDSYCARVGRQMSRGEYIFTLYSESQVPDIQKCLMSGKFQTR